MSFRRRLFSRDLPQLAKKTNSLFLHKSRFLSQVTGDIDDVKYRIECNQKHIDRLAAEKEEMVRDMQIGKTHFEPVPFVFGAFISVVLLAYGPATILGWPIMLMSFGVSPDPKNVARIEEELERRKKYDEDLRGRCPEKK